MKRLLATLIIIQAALIVKSQSVVILNLAENCNTTNSVAATPEAQDDLTVFPNPNEGIFKVSLHSNTNTTRTEVKVYDVNLKIVYAEELPNPSATSTHELNLSWLHDGVYFIFLNTDEQVFSSKIVINH